MKVDYSKRKIYKLVDMVNGYFYIGSTCNSLSRRLYEHRAKAKQFPERKVYRYLNEIGFENIRIILIIDYPDCTNKNENLEKSKNISIYI